MAQISHHSRGKKSPCENPPKSPFGRFLRGDLSRFHPENTFIRHGTNQLPFMPCHINVFSGRKHERSPRVNPPKGDFVGFSHGNLSPRQAKIRQTVAKNATHGMSRTSVWWSERSPCENTKIHHFAGFHVATFYVFAPVCQIFPCRARGRHAKTRQITIFARQAKIGQTGGEKSTHEKRHTFVWRGERSPRENTQIQNLASFQVTPFHPENTIIRHGTNQPP